MWKKEASIKNRLNMLLVICLVPLTVLILYLVVIMQQFSGRYDEVVENITKANAYNIDFKDDLDYQMYIIVANSERADELIDTAEPRRMIEEAREVFQGLYESADAEYGKQRLNRILKRLNILEDRVIEIETDAKVSGFYDKNMERLDLDIRVLTELIQEQIQEYIYYETTNLEVLREGIRSDVDRTLRMTSIIFLLILVSAFLISQKLMQGIMVPIGRLCEVTRKAAGGDFTVRAKEDNSAELSVLNSSFNSMIEKIGNLVEDIRVEQLNLRATELKLLQAQINPHFLYNTLDTIIWLAEAGKKDDVVMMVTTLSDFFRTTLSKGRDYISVREEEAHIRSYLQIQQFRYRDILEYSIDIPEELYGCQVLKLTLQPVVENALYHGIKSKRGMGHIAVKGRRLGNLLLLTVEDDGMGMTEERLEAVRRGLSKETDSGDGDGFGLYNIQQRIKLYYGQEYGMEIDSQYGKGTRVEITIPVKKP